jgi:hypothetical protein
LPDVLEIRRVKIRSVLKLVFLFHAFIGVLIGLIITVLWTAISLFGLHEIVPSFLPEAGRPETASILILLSVIALSAGLVGALVWALIILLYNVVAGFTRGIQVEVVEETDRKRGAQTDDE